MEVIVVDNSGSGRARGLLPQGSRAQVIENRTNLGFGGAVNQGINKSQARYVATLNDDAVAHPDWVAALVAVLEERPTVGMCASSVQLQDSHTLDSAGMLICGDASSTQRGHGLEPSQYSAMEDALLPSGSAAMYRRAMLAEIGGFDADFFLYCEDTDLGLRAIRAGWQCAYVAGAQVEHRYSHSAGRASALKAYYVERNRLWVALKNFPFRMLLAAPAVTVARYFWHLAYMLQGRGKAAQFAEGGGGGLNLVWLVLRAHLATLVSLPQLLAKRRAIQATSRIGAAEFTRILRRHSVGARQVASH
jgi:GT2 family glycosyltransferase